MAKSNVKKKGYIYIIKNDAWEGWCKIGQTTAGIEKRLKAYQTGSPFRDYYSVFELLSEDVAQLEFNIHDRLVEEGLTYNSEWFKVPEEEAIRIITEEYLKDTKGNT